MIVLLPAAAVTPLHSCKKTKGNQDLQAFLILSKHMVFKEGFKAEGAIYKQMLTRFGNCLLRHITVRSSAAS